MNTATNKMKALVAGGAALAAFGIGTMLPATATPDGGTGQPGIGEVGPPHDKVPQGQATGDDNNGWQCDGNGGVGQGNPAHEHNCDSDAPPPGNNGNHGEGNNGGGNDDSGDDGGNGTVVAPDYGT